jgi:hypothetical protein
MSVRLVGGVDRMEEYQQMSMGKNPTFWRNLSETKLS